MRTVKSSKQNNKCFPQVLMSSNFLLRILSLSVLELPETASIFLPMNGTISSLAIINEGPSGIFFQNSYKWQAKRKKLAVCSRQYLIANSISLYTVLPSG